VAICLDIGLRHDRFEPPRTEIAGHSALVRAGRFVVSRLGGDLRGSGVSVVLIDEQARIVDRCAGDMIFARRLDRLMLAPGFVWRVDTVGTTALGLAARHNTPATVHGSEHFMDVLTTLTTVAVPVCVPSTGRLCGALALVCGADIADVLLLPTARRGAREVELRLADGGTDRQRLIDEAFLRHRRAHTVRSCSSTSTSCGRIPPRGRVHQGRQAGALGHGVAVGRIGLRRGQLRSRLTTARSATEA
jgi:transcriptional regulator of acetoin/glycerol metabolism